VEPGKLIAATVVAGEVVTQQLQVEAEAISSLARVAPSQLEWVDPASEQPAEGVVRLVVDEAIEALLPLSEMVDAAKERARLGKQKAKLEADIEKISNRLNAPGFADKAPPAIIDKAKNELKDFSEQLDGVLSALEQLPTE